MQQYSLGNIYRSCPIIKKVKKNNVYFGGYENSGAAFGTLH